MSYRRGANRPYFTSRVPYTPPVDPSLPPDRDIKDGLNATALKMLSKPAASLASTAPIKLKDLTYIGSYNWTEASDLTVIVPGAP